MFECDYEGRCLNTDRCLICNDHRLLKLPEDSGRLKNQNKARYINKKKDTKSDCSESWKDLESSVAARVSAIPTTKQYIEMKEARRQVRSGAIWFMPGDVADTIILAECKERSQTTASGEKSITIPKSWLTKVEEEARMDGKYPTFAFRYKNDDQIYSINKFEVLEDMVLEIKFLRVDNENLKLERENYQAHIRQLEREIELLKKEKNQP